MTFDEWWKVMKPAECDELKEYFIEAYQLGFNHGYRKGVAAFHEAVKLEREECAKICDAFSEEAWKRWKERYYPHDEGLSDGAAACAADIRARSNVPPHGNVT